MKQRCRHRGCRGAGYRTEGAAGKGKHTEQDGELMKQRCRHKGSLGCRGAGRDKPG